MRRFGPILLVLAAVLAACGSKGAYKNVDPEDLHAHLDDPGVVVVDVRTPAEYQSGHVPRAINLPLQEIEEWAGDLPKDRTVYLICNSGNRSTKAAEYLKEKGYKNLRNVTGGTKAWVKKGYPLSTAPEDPAKVLGKAPSRPRMSLPDLTLKRLGAGEVSLRKFLGRPVVVNLWASWCPPCRAEMPLLAEAQSRYKDVTFLFVNQGEDEATIHRFLSETGLPLGWVLLDPDSAMSRMLRAGGLPTTYFFNARGELVATHPGQLFEAALEGYLQKLAEE